MGRGGNSTPGTAKEQSEAALRGTLESGAKAQNDGGRGHVHLRGGNEPYPHEFSARQMEALSAVCETFLPGLPLEASGLSAADGDGGKFQTKDSAEHLEKFYRLSSSSMGIASAVAGRLSESLNRANLSALVWVLRLLSTGLGTFVLFGRVTLGGNFPYVQKFSALSPELREKALQSWAKSSLVVFQKGFKLFKSYILFACYSKVDKNGRNPCWDGIGYPGPETFLTNAESKDTKRPLEGKVLDSNQSKGNLRSLLAEGGFTVFDDVSHLRSMYKQNCAGESRESEFGVECDVLVVGSGSGGGVMAGILAKAGLKVLVLEKGQYYAREDFSLLESPSMARMYEGAGTWSTDDGSVSLLAGSTVGGGSTINWSASLQTPQHVRQEWADQHGLSFFATERYQQAMDAVCKRLGVEPVCKNESFQNHNLTAGCRALGYDIGQAPQNARDGHACGWCNLGCRTGAKQSTSETWLVDAVTSGALILSNCEALGVLHEENVTNDTTRKLRKAVGVAAALGEGAILYIHARATVISCGSLNTPPLLLKSGLRNPNIGKNLHLHPVIMGWGYFPEGKGAAGSCYDGPIMTSVSKEAANWESSGYGVLLETPILHPGVFSALTPWVSGSDHRKRMTKYSRTSHFIVLARDKGSGAVGLDSTRRPTIFYALSDYDKSTMLVGLEKGLRAMAAAGAVELGTHHSDGEIFNFHEKSRSTSADFEAFLERTRARGLCGLRFPVSSAHQMGSCKMGVDRRDSVVDPSGETWEVEGLYLGDASVFPTASGVNPMITVQSIAFCTAQNVLQKLQVVN